MKQLTASALVLWNYYQGWQTVRIKIKRFGNKKAYLCRRCIHSELFAANKKEYSYLTIPEKRRLLKCDRCQALYAL